MPGEADPLAPVARQRNETHAERANRVNRAIADQMTASLLKRQAQEAQRARANDAEALPEGYAINPANGERYYIGGPDDPNCQADPEDDEYYDNMPDCTEVAA
jgi:hypothetical protein